jgi:hypothetical protein
MHKDSFVVNFCLLFLLVLALHGYPVPHSNESAYLAALAKTWQPDYLLNDWTFSVDIAHTVFNHVFGPLTLLFSLEVVGWLGRISCWALSLIALLRLGKKFRIPTHLITLSIAIWLLYGQSIVGGGWIIGGFEAKCIAYIFLLFSLSGFISEKNIVPSILLGLSFSFHPSVGLWGVLGVTLTLMFLKYRPTTLLGIGALTLLFSLPGLLPVFPTAFGDQYSTSGDAQAIVFSRMSSILDPFTWPKSLVILLFILFIFNCFHFRTYREKPALRFIIYFQFATLIFFLLGIFARLFEFYWYLRLFPFRLFPQLVLLFFFFQLMHAYQYQTSLRPDKLTAAVAFLALLTLWNPFWNSFHQLRIVYRTWRKEHTSMQKSFAWVAENTPNESVVISPPWIRESFYFTERAQIACWYKVRVDRLTEWRQRVETLTGKINPVPSFSAKEAKMRHTRMRRRMEDHYNNLSQNQIKHIVNRYGGDYLIHRREYNYPLLCCFGEYKIYRISKLHTQFSDADTSVK